jgi:hypothetical protein
MKTASLGLLEVILVRRAYAGGECPPDPPSLCFFFLVTRLFGNIYILGHLVGQEVTSNLMKSDTGYVVHRVKLLPQHSMSGRGSFLHEED